MRSLILSLTCLLGACGGVYMPGRAAHFEPDTAAAEINDDDVKKAFEAKPQLAEHPNIAYFSFDPSKNADVENVLHSLPGVGTVYAIPPLAVTGQRRFDTPGFGAQPAPLSTKKLRLLAARAHCDLLVVVDYGHRTDVSANALAALDILILPALFLPFREVKVESYFDAFVVDTRNGYLYGEATASHEDTRNFQTIYADDDALVGKQWSTLKTELQTSLVSVFKNSKG